MNIIDYAIYYATYFTDERCDFFVRRIAIYRRKKTTQSIA